MFSYVEESGRLDLARKAAMFLISTVAHLAAILVLILLPLIFIGAVPEMDLLSFVLAAPAPPPAPIPPAPPVGVKARAALRQVITEDFREPKTIPEGVIPQAPEPMPGDYQPDVNAGLSGSPLGDNPGIPGSPLGHVLPEASAPAPPPPLPPRPAKKPAIRTGGQVQESKLISRVEPEYPRLAILARVSGVVVLDVRVDEEGNVESIRVLQGHTLLVEAARSAVAQWKYSPTILNGEPVPVLATVTVIFTLQ